MYISCEIAMGDLQSEEERDIVLELKLPAMASPQQDMVLKATLSYFNVITSEFDTVQSELNIQRGGKQDTCYYSLAIVHNYRVTCTSKQWTREGNSLLGPLLWEYFLSLWDTEFTCTYSDPFTTDSSAYIISLLIGVHDYIHVLDGDRGAPSTTVDIQRNRILTTAALRKAEPLANQGR